MSLTTVAFLLLFLGGCLASLARHPIYGLMTYVAVFYLHPPSRWWGEVLPDLRWSLIAAFVTLVSIGLRRSDTTNSPILTHAVVPGLLAFLAWLLIQIPFALDLDRHIELVTLFAKYVLLIGLICRTLDSESHLRVFLWGHVLGCFYLGYLVLSDYAGGRFEGFGGPGIGDANTGALQVVTGILTATGLFLAGRTRERVSIVFVMPLIVNALVATISRSGFLAVAVGGVIFNWFSPRQFRRRVVMLSLLGGVLFLALTNQVYWQRIESVKYAGEEVQGLDTGAGRLVIIEAQWNMFVQYPFGCGHRCTATLSPSYLDDRHLTGSDDNRARSSHMTIMTLLVEHGVVGIVLYLGMQLWIFQKLRTLARRCRNESGVIACLFPAVAGVFAAIFVGELFVDYLKLEARIWFIATLIVMLNLSNARASQSSSPTVPSRSRREASVGASVRRAS